MKSNATTQRVSYLQPVCTFVNVQLDSGSVEKRWGNFLN